MGEASTVLVRIEAGTDRFDPLSDQWTEQVGQLWRDLAGAAPVERATGTAEPGSKGLAETTVIALTSAGTMTTVLGMFRAWLSRDKGRRLTITWSAPGHEERVVIEGDAIEPGTFDKIVESVRLRMGDEPSWTDDTGRS